VTQVHHDEGTGGAAAATTGASVLRGGGWNSLTLVVPQLYTLAVSIAAARFLGEEAFGRQSFIAFVSLSVGLLVSGALPVAVVRYVGETLGRGQAAQVRGLVRWAWWVQGATALVGAALLVAVALAGADPRSAWLLAAVATLLGVLHNVPTAALIGLQRWRQASIVGLSTGLVSVAATIVVLAAGGGITGMFAVEAAIAAFNLAWTSSLARRSLHEVSPAAAPPGELRRLVLRYALLDSIGVVLTLVVWRRSELFFLERWASDSEIAHYSIPFAMVTALTLLPAALAGALAPAVATLLGAGSLERIRSGYGRAMRLIGLVSLPLTAAGLALGPTLLLLVYGQEYAEGQDVLRIMLIGFPLVATMHASLALLTGLGRILVPTVACGVAAAINIGLDVALIPGGGATGAAIANLGGQVTAAVLVSAYALRAVGGIQMEARALVGAIVASAAGGLAAWAVARPLPDGPGFVLGLAAGVAVFGLVATVLRVIPAADAAWLEEAAGGRLSGVVGRVCRAWGARAPEAPA
jgi:O-antigen/teichoic acid export membrane protein